jgi:hypothetical protein
LNPTAQKFNFRNQTHKLGIIATEACEPYKKVEHSSLYFGLPGDIRLRAPQFSPAKNFTANVLQLIWKEGDN